ncbi:MAG: glycosyltransferase family 2 protein [Bdellovibrionota bacterium]
MKRTLVAVIAYNEEKNLETTLNDLRHNGPAGLEIVVIDNGSSDRTKAVALAAGVPVVSHCVNSGSSMGTVMSYFLYAHRNKFDCLCQFDGDGQHVASELPKIIAPVLEGRADYVIGSRFLTKEGFQSYFFRRLGISLFAFLDSLVVGQKLTDVTSGFRAYSPRVLEFFAQRHRHELSDTNQLLLLSHFAGARILEVPVVMRPRVHGVSEFRSSAAIVFPLKGVVNILGCLLQRKRIRKTWA